MKSATTGIAPRLYRRACDLLAADIANGVIVHGTRLTETMVANRFGMDGWELTEVISQAHSIYRLSFELAYLMEDGDEQQQPALTGGMVTS